MSRSSRARLLHMQDEVRFLLTSVSGLDQANFFDDELLKRAFVRSLEIIGEASKYLPASLLEQYPQVPWREVIGMRDRLIHQYFTVNYQVVWETVRLDIPKLEETLKLILARDDL